MANFDNIIQEINTNLPDNSTQAITAAKLRTTLIDLTNTIDQVQDDFETNIEEELKFDSGQLISNVSIVDNLESNDGSTSVLSAKQGKILKNYVDDLNNDIYTQEEVISTSVQNIYITAESQIDTYTGTRLTYIPVNEGDIITIKGVASGVGSNFRMGVSTIIPAYGGSVSGLDTLPGGTTNFTKTYAVQNTGYFCISYIQSYGSIYFYTNKLAFEKVKTTKVKFMLGAISTLGGLRYGLRDDRIALKSMVSVPYKLNGCKIVAIEGVDNDETFYIHMYSKSFEYLGNTSSVDNVVNCEYVIFSRNKNDAYNCQNVFIDVTWEGSDEFQQSHYYQQPGNPRFLMFEVERLNSVNPTSSNYDSTERLWTNGYVILPPNYTIDGEPVPLAIFVHGTGGYVFNETQISYYTELLQFVAKNGYAVVDCCTMSNKYSNTYDLNGNLRTEYKDTNYPCRLSVDCYISLYKYVTEMFNIDKSRVFAWGKSSGGRLASVLGNSKLIPIKAIGILNGSTDSFTDYRVLGNSTLTSVKKMMEDDLGFTNIPNSFVVSNMPYKNPNNIPASLIDYFMDNIDKIAGYNPLFTGISNLDIETYERAQFTCSLEPSEIGTSLTNNTTLMGEVNNGFKTSFIPTKIWAAEDDENVPYPMAVIYNKLVKRGGGICELRTIPAGNGKHWAVDIAQPNLGQLYPGTGYPNDLPYAPKTNYVTKLGETISEVTVTYAELVDWFNRW